MYQVIGITWDGTRYTWMTTDDMVEATNFAWMMYIEKWYVTVDVINTVTGEIEVHYH